MEAKLLIIDDNDDNLFCLKFFLQDIQCTLVEASGPEEALAVLIDDPVFDLVITDFNLSHPINGLKLVEKIHSLHNQLPVVLWSSDPAIVEPEVHASGAIEHFQKDDGAGICQFVQKFLSDRFKTALDSMEN